MMLFKFTPLKFTSLAFACALLAACSPSTETLRLNDRPLKFHLVKSNDPSLFATYPGGTVSIAQVTDDSPVEQDLKTQQNLIRLEAVLRKYAADPKSSSTPLEIYLPAPKTPLTDLMKSWGLPAKFDNKISFKPTAPAQGVIAQWGDQQVNASETDAASARLALIKVRAYREDLNRLSGIVIRRELLAAAQAEKLEIDAYVQKHITSDTTPLTDSQFEAFLAAKNIKKGDINGEQEKSLRNIALADRKSAVIEEYVVKNLLKGDVDVHVMPPSFTVAVPQGWSAIWGVEDAPISVLYFGDLVCGPCRDGLKNVIDASNEYAGHIKVGFNFLFSPNDRDSRMISEAALCVQAQGTKKFRTFAETYATNPPGVEEADIQKTAELAGVNLADYKKCFLAREHQSLLNQHLDFANRVGITSQPTVLVDGEPLAGTISKADLNDLIDRKVHSKSSAIGALWRRFKALFS